jgi:hypothetical protein
MVRFVLRVALVVVLVSLLGATAAFGSRAPSASERAAIVAAIEASPSSGHSRGYERIRVSSVDPHYASAVTTYGPDSQKPDWLLHSTGGAWHVVYVGTDMPDCDAAPAAVRRDLLRSAICFDARPPASALPAPVLTGFVLPSRNIACNAGPADGMSLLDCTVFSEASATKGQKDWTMYVTGPARVSFHLSNAATDLPVLVYGHTWRWHDIACTSQRSGLTCKNREGRGFFLSREAQRLF